MAKTETRGICSECGCCACSNCRTANGNCRHCNKPLHVTTQIRKNDGKGWVNLKPIPQSN